ncbi:MAG: hypothetical protein JO295_03390 [Verrucomicrobia bacterium]|nr:hypothetical protein [Verrucomicrobiota bacterium]
MSEPAAADKPEPTPFEKLQAFTRQILAVPKAEIDRREREWRKQRQSNQQRRGNVLGGE